MSAFNWFSTKKKAFDLRTKSITTSSTVGTYTVRTGRVVDNFVVDRVINVTTTSTYDLAVTIPDGLYSGQRLNINYIAEGDNASVTFTVTSGSATDLTAATGYTILEWTHDSCDGWVEIKVSAT